MRLGPLTPRETEIALLIADGHRGESVANQLHVEISTVKRHISNITMKLGINSSLEVAAWYYKTYWQPKAAN